MRSTRKSEGPAQKVTDVPHFGKVTQPHERDVLYRDELNLRDTNAVLHMLDALETRGGKQRMLQCVLMIIAGIFLLIAVGLLVSRYTEGFREPSQASVLQDLSKGAMNETFDLMELEYGQDAVPGAFLAVDQKAFRSSGMAATASLQPATELLAANGITAQLPMSSSARAPASSEVAVLMNTAANAYRSSCVNTDHAVTTTQTHGRQLSAGQRSSSANLASAKGWSPGSRVVKHKDADVDLIALFLARTQQDSSGDEGDGQDLQTNALPEVDLSKRYTGLRKRTPISDVVIRTQADTTESLVKRCGTLGLIEGHLCRVRICSGLWGKEAACPAGNTANVH